MGLLDDYSGKGGLLGIGMTPRPKREHQHIKHLIECGITDDGYYALSEQCINDDDINSKAPDVLIYEDKSEKFPLTYEKRRWFCFGDDLDDKNPSYSEIFNTDFNDYLD